MTPLLQASKLSKSYPGVRALEAVNLQVAAGEVLAVVGENGAGKSTLMKIVAGVETADAGAIRFDNQVVRFRSVRDALAAGIVLIHQELNLAENLSVAANVFLGREITHSIGWLNRGAMDEQSRRLLDRLGVSVPTSAKVADLPIGQRQLVEIARAIGQSARLIIMDEPTSSLSQHETETLFGVIRELKRSGVAILYISHRLAEVKAIADRVTVLRDGKNAGELTRDEICHDAIVKLMVGRDLNRQLTRTPRSSANRDHRLEVRNLRLATPPSKTTTKARRHEVRTKKMDFFVIPSCLRAFVVRLLRPSRQIQTASEANESAESISFSIQSGEIVGLAGLVGAGRTELAEALVGIRPIAAGDVRIDGKPVRIRSPRDALRHGLLLAPEDRRQHGLIVEGSVQANISLPNLDQISTAGWVRPRSEAALARTWVDRLKVKTPSLRQTVGLLSGGNQQKVVFAKWLARKPRVLILDEPTRGVDVGARAEIYALIDQLSADGVAVLMISSDLEEILCVSDRVLVMHEGRIAGELSRVQLSEQAVMNLATGGG